MSAWVSSLILPCLIVLVAPIILEVGPFAFTLAIFRRELVKSHILRQGLIAPLWLRMKYKIQSHKLIQNQRRGN